MQRLQAFKYVLMPNGEQARKMCQCAGMARLVFNRGLALQQARHEAGDKKLGYTASCKALTGWRNSAETPWLKAGPIHPLQQSLKDLERAYANFFAKQASFPRFKKKGQRDSFRLTRPETDQARPGQPPPLPSQAGLATLSPEPRGAGDGEEHYRQPVRWAVVRLDSDRARDHGAGPHRRLCRYRHGRGAFRHALGRPPSSPAQQLQNASRGTAQGAAVPESQDEIQ